MSFALHDPEARRLAALDREDRAYARWSCPQCGGGHHHHMQGCPEASCDDDARGDASAHVTGELA